MTTVFLLQIPHSLPQGDFLRLGGHISPEKQKRIRRSRKAHHQRAILLADLLLRRQLLEKTGLENHALRFTVNLHGKPALLNVPDLHFNLSHSGSHIVCAMGDRPLGIDIETIRPLNLTIAERFFAPEEAEAIQAAPMDKQQLLFFAIWTKKEAYVKYLGQGLFSQPLHSFNVLEEMEGVCFDEIPVSGGTVCHMCRERAGDFTCHWVSPEDLIRDFLSYV